MPCSCIRQTDLPGASRLFADALYHPERVERFYRHPHRDLESYRAAAREAALDPARRAALTAALARLNPGSPSLERLAQLGTVAVVTGQQVGLFSGPSYTVYKALAAARLAERLTERGIPAVPLFWLATEDHDFPEVSHAWVFDAAHRPARLDLKRGAPPAQPVGGVALEAPPTAELRERLAGLPFAEETADLVERWYTPGRSMGEAFQGLVGELLREYGILFVDPMAPEFRSLAAPALRNALDAASDLSADLAARNAELSDAGYHAQVHLEPHTSLVFLLENGKRLALRRQGRDYLLNGRRFSTEELKDRAESLSPNALLRPVVQDSMLPTVAYVGGPAEIAYLAQSAAIYRNLLGRQPLAVPRAGFTLLDARSHKLFGRYGLKLADFYAGEDGVRQHIAARLVPASLGAAMRESAGAVDGAMAELHGALEGFDPTLAAALERSLRKVRYQFEKIERKTGRAVLARDQRASHDASSLAGLVFPEKHLQERLYSFLPFLAKHGFGLTAEVYANIDPDCPDHRLLVV